MGCTHAVESECLVGLCWHCAVQYALAKAKDVVSAAPVGAILVLWYTPGRSPTEGVIDVFVDSLDRLSREEPELYALCEESLEALPLDAPFRWLPWVANLPGKFLQGIVGDPSTPTAPWVQA